MAVAVRAGDEILGSIWVVVRTPLTEERSQALCDAAKLVALHMLRIRAGADVERRLRADLVSTALEGGAGARDALDRLGLADQPVVVLALAVPVSDSIVGDAGLATERQRLADAFAMHLGAVHPRSAAALVGDVAYGLIPVPTPTARRTPYGSRRTSSTGSAIGSRPRSASAPSSGRTPGCRTPAPAPTGHSAYYEPAAAPNASPDWPTSTSRSLLLELRDLIEARGDQPTGPIARLIAYDREHNSSLVETLRAWLDAFGDVIAAAARSTSTPTPSATASAGWPRSAPWTSTTPRPASPPCSNSASSRRPST